MHASSSNDLSGLEKSLDYKFKKKSLLREALTHKSYAHEQQKKPIHFNERMEFLGDSVLELIVSEYLYSTFSDLTEAGLSRMKAYAVQESSLSEVAKSLNLGAYLKLGRGEELTGGRKKPSLLANAFEAILAAIYIDGGYKKARDFVLSHLMAKLDDLAANKFIFDFKTRLQEVAQANYGVLPKYVTHREEGPEHKKTFEVKVLINDKVIGSGKGSTKKAASQKAAEGGLKKLSTDNETDL
jgi:ribonuclease-3